MADKGFIMELHTPKLEIYEPGLYVNYYKYGGMITESRYFESPEEAKQGIQWEKPGVEYLFTAKVTDKIYKYERP